MKWRIPNLNKPELLAPAGDFECLKSAILYGADAIYLGSTMFGMRANAAKFSFDLLEKSVDLAHKNGVKIYLTCNTIPSNSEMLKLKEFLQNAQNIGVDALIVADFGAIMEAKKFAPKIKLHISTQFGVFNFKTASALYDLGAKRVILARELSLDEIKFIRQNTPSDLEIECFVHGAICVSISGRCLISQYLLGRNANRGECAQPCRWSYDLIERTRPNEFFSINENQKGSYILNSKDLCLIKKLNELKNAGISSFKIEGRAKSAYYVGTITNAYRSAIDEMEKNDYSPQKNDSVPWFFEEVEKVSHRPYFEGFMFNKPFCAHTSSQHYESGGYIRKCDVVAVVENFYDGLLQCKQKNKFSVYDCLELVLVNKKPIVLKIKKMFDENKNEIESAPHAEMKIFILCDFKDFGKNLKLEGCFLRRNS